MSWGNQVASIRWNWLITRKLFSNLTISYSMYDYENENSKIGEIATVVDSVKRNTNNYSLQNSGIENISFTEDFSLYTNNTFTFKFGYGIKLIEFVTGSDLVIFQVDDQESQSGSTERYSAVEQSAYLENNISFSKKISTNIGFRYSGFNTDNASYHFLEPRISAQWNISNKVSVKAGYGRMNQYVHLLSFSRISLSNDIWVPVTKTVSPATSDQFSLAFLFGVKEFLAISIEGFYKAMDNIIEYKEGATLSDNNVSWQEMIESGEGTSKGIEILIDKHHGKLNGWISYTLARSDRNFPEINNGYSYPFKYSRTHDLKATLNYQVFRNWSIGSTVILRSGHYETVPVQKMATVIRGFYDVPSSEHLLYLYNRNNFRFPLYKRVDLAIQWSKQFNRFRHSISFGAYNLLNFKNPYKYYLEENIEYEHGTGDFRSMNMIIKEKNLFTILPSFSYSIHF
jgi:hypothetical protein